MVDVVFYEKPGCINNTRQKQLLKKAGHHVIANNLLEHLWTPDVLAQFFANEEISNCFNRSNPKVKSGEIDPGSIDKETALAMMCKEPLLIRRPLMEIEGEFYVGFDADLMQERIGLAPVEGNPDLESCPRSHSESACKETP